MWTLAIVIVLGTGVMDIIVQGLMYLGLGIAWAWEHLDEVDITDL